MPSLNLDLGRNVHVGLVKQFNPAQTHHTALLLLVPLAITGPPGHARGSISEDQALGAKRGLVLCIQTSICLGNTSHLRDRGNLEGGRDNALFGLCTPFLS